MYFYRARYYDAELGRFISRDPIGIADDVNLYAYVGNDAINYSDPLGLYSWGEFGNDVGGAWDSLSNDPRVNGGVKIAGGLLDTAFGTFMIVDGVAVCTTIGGCMIGVVLVPQGTTHVLGGVGTIFDGITQLVTGEFEDRGSRYLDVVDNGLSVAGANCKTKAIVNGVQTIIDTAYIVKGIVKIGSKIFKSKRILGGSYEEVSAANKGMGGNTNHMPAAAAAKHVPKTKGVALYMEFEDHKLTKSYGRGLKQDAWRAQQSEYIKNGEVEKAFQMDVDDIRSKFGNKYDVGIKQAKKYLQTIKHLYNNQ